MSMLNKLTEVVTNYNNLQKIYREKCKECDEKTELIKTLQMQTQDITSLQQKIEELQTQLSGCNEILNQVEKVIEIPVEKVIETPVEKVIETPVEKVIETPVEKVIETPVEKVIETPEESINGMWRSIESPVQQKNIEKQRPKKSIFGL